MPYNSHGLGSTRNYYVDPPSLVERVGRIFSSKFRKPSGRDGGFDPANGTLPTRKQKAQARLLQRLFSIRSILICVWLLTLWWGERLVFSRSVQACRWQHWEHWPSEAIPHHAVLIADPQLVDPHTYPGRPWPLSSMTIFFTDLYLRRSYSLLHAYLQPDTIFFLGDLFDGGREWSTQHSSSPEDRFKRYDNSFWMKEYKRFGDIFFSSWSSGSILGTHESRGHKIIASLPGNHDLGFAAGVQTPVKNRFDAYFGPLNRIDVVGNHTFVSLDTISLSATDLTQFATATLVSRDGTAISTPNAAIWEPVQSFLDDVGRARERATQRELRVLGGLGDQAFTEDGLSGFAPNISSVKYKGFQPYQNSDELLLRGSGTPFPTILLTHVPLYRPPDTDCGPLRERNHAIPVEAGYQYQNVLTPSVSEDIISKLGTKQVTQVYSGDDHDYCKVEHSVSTGRVREVTVKSMSWAMGVRRPGFLAVSLHNPVELGVLGVSTGDRDINRGTVQDHLCLLPDQLAIFIRYGVVLGITVVVLALRAAIWSGRHRWAPEAANVPLLPLTNEMAGHHHRASASSVSSSSPKGRLAVSSRSSRNQSPSELGSYGKRPPSSAPDRLDAFPPTKNAQVSMVGLDDSDDWGMPTTKVRNAKLRGMGADFLGNLYSIAWPVLLFYGWILWNG